MPHLFSRKSEADMADAAKEFRNKKTLKKRSQIIMLERVGIGIGALLAFLIVFFIGFLFLGSGPKAHSGKRTTFIINSGMGAGKISKELKDENLIRSDFAFRTLSIITGAGKRIKPGEYEIPSGSSPLRILKIIARGDAVAHRITIPEGFPMVMVYDRLKANEVLSGDLPNLPPEGSIAPDTYQLKRGDNRETIIRQMMERQTKIIDELWLSRTANSPIKTKEEALILASIVEKETGIASERPRIAAVFLNRLREGMKLQSDPTIIYGITKGKPLGRKILKSEIDAHSAWNTYVINGLPKTPICNPGKDAIAAVLKPDNVKDLFFVADGSGGHVFAETYAEHERNVAKWREFRANQEKNSDNIELRGAK
jgi:UPF0755 protein